jgi:hypothetical protein
VTPTSPRRSAAALAGALLASLCLAAPASALDAGSITKSAGDVEATVSWDAAELGVANPRMTIARSGATVFDGPITDVCPPGCFLVADDPQYSNGSILHVVDLSGDGVPEVSLDTFSGGAHCCIVQRIYGRRPADGFYTRVRSQYWGNSGYDIVDLDGDGVPEMSGSEDAFAYAFSSYASSVFPPKIIAFGYIGNTATAVTEDRTRRFPAIIRKQAARLLKDIRNAPREHGTHEIQGAIAAYVADRYLLGQAKVARAELRRARRLGLTAKGFETELLRFLKRLGYRK